MSWCIEKEIQPRPALQVYDGHLYKCALGFRDEVASCLDAGELDVYVVSAGYGIVHPLDPIQRYEAEMKGRVATLWREAGLVDVVSELIRVSRARRVFGFFTGPSHWKGQHAKYRCFFTEGLMAAIAGGAPVSTGACFYRAEGMGVPAIYGALGRTLLKGLRADFSSDFFAGYVDGQRDGNVLIRSEIICGSR